MGNQRQLGMVLLVIAVAVGCGDDAELTSHPESEDLELEAPLAESFPLPFGIVQPDGLVPIGRPVAVEEVQVVYAGVPITGHSLSAAYWVTAEDPTAAVQAWVEQLGGMGLDRVVMTYGAGPRGPWIEATSVPPLSAVPGPVGPSDWANLQLWATDGVPILIVDLHRVEDAQRTPDITDELGDVREPLDVVMIDERTAGDVLFTEVNAVHLPPGTRALMPTIPNGGSYSVLAADDADAAIAALLDEARMLSDHEVIREPEVIDAAGNRIVKASFNIPAGGWAFWMLAVQAPGDPYATVYVRSASD